MKRKLIQQGGGRGFTIYLPKQWIDKRQLGAGDEVDINMTDERLIIQGIGKTIREKRLNISGNPRPFIRMEIMNMYRLGFDRIFLTYETDRELNQVKKVLKELLGFTLVKITQEDKTSVALIESISEPSLEKYDSIVNRMLFIFQEILTLVLNNETKGVSELVREAYKYDHFCKRAISKQILQKEHSTLYWAFHLQLIHSIRDASFLSDHLQKPSKKIVQLIKQALVMLEHLKQAYMKKDEKELLPLYTKRSRFLNEGYHLFKSEDPVATHHLFDIMRNIYLTASPLFSLLTENHQ